MNFFWNNLQYWLSSPSEKHTPLDHDISCSTLFLNLHRHPMSVSPSWGPVQGRLQNRVAPQACITWSSYPIHVKG